MDPDVNAGLVLLLPGEHKPGQCAILIRVACDPCDTGPTHIRGGNDALDFELHMYTSALPSEVCTPLISNCQRSCSSKQSNNRAFETHHGPRKQEGECMHDRGCVK